MGKIISSLYPVCGTVGAELDYMDLSFIVRDLSLV